MALYGLSIEGRDGVFDTDGSLMMIEPELAGEQDGCKLYKNQVIIIANEKPVWIPVTVKSYDEALIRYYEKRKKENPEEATTAVFFIEKIKEEMLAFSPEELNSPAYYGGRIGGCPENIEHAGAFVKLNPKYFDKNKPRTATQLIILEVPCIATEVQETTLYRTDEFSSFQATRLTEILKSFKFAEWKRFFD